MMVVLRAFALVVIGVGAGALHHQFGKPIVWTAGANTAGPLDLSKRAGGANGEGARIDDGTQPQQGDPATDPATDASDASADPVTPTEAPPAELTYDDLEVHVGLEGAVIIYDMAMEGTASIIDARPPEDFAAGHIPMAFNLTTTQFRRGIPEAVDYMPMDLPVLIYCEGGTCHDSESIAISLRELGFERLHIFTDGYPAWEEAGYEIERGSDG